MQIVLKLEWVEGPDGDFTLKVGPMHVGEVYWCDLDSKRYWYTRGYGVLHGFRCNLVPLEEAKKSLETAIIDWSLS